MKMEGHRLLVVGAVCAALAGCGSSGFDSGGSGEPGGPVAVETGEGTVALGEEDGEASIETETGIETDEGSFSAGGDLPDLWPADFPVPEGAEVQQGGSFTDESGSQVTATFVTDAGGAETFVFYHVALVDSIGSQSSGDAGGQFFGNLSLVGRWNGNIAVQTDPTDGRTTVNVILAV